MQAVSGSISLPFRGSFRLSYRDWSTIGLSVVFSLARWSSQFQSGFLVSRPTQDPTISIHLYSYRTFTSYGPTFQKCSNSYVYQISRSFYPAVAKTTTVWAFPRSIATTKGITLLFYFPPGTKMFQFPGFASISLRVPRLHRGGLPHSDTCGYIGYLLLPTDFRSLSRPSSPLRAQAFTIRSYRDWETDRKSTRLNSSHSAKSRMPSSA